MCANTPKLRFIYITEYDISIDNGPGINEREFIKALYKELEEQIVCVIPSPEYPEKYFDSRIKYVKNHNNFNKFKYWGYVIDTLIKVLKLHRKHQFDALILRIGQTPIVPLVLSWLMKVPLIFKTLAKYSKFSGEYNWKGRIINYLWLPLLKTTVKRAVVVDTVSIPYIDWLHYKFGISKDKLILIPNGMNIEYFFPGDQKVSRQKLNLNTFDHLIGYIGALNKNRNIEMLIKSIKFIECNGSVGLILVGDGKDKNELKKLAKKEGIADRVIFTGQVSYELVPEYMRAMDIASDLTLIAMKIGNRLSNSSYSQKIPQYLACGLPVIAWDVVDNQFISKEKIGEVVPYGNIVNLSKSLSKLLNLDVESKKALRKRAISYSHTNLSVNNLTARRIKFWEKAINKNSH
ncbi:MAG: glycosyltransferase [Calditrichales bacterium]|nr:glycosyltransferase [Calditrichales bacterium]